MTHGDKGNYKSKHSPAEILDEGIAGAVKTKTVGGEITCADASNIADDLGVSMKEVGLTIDLMEIEIAKCQLGLFGYGPKKMAIKAAEAVQPDLEKAIRGALVKDRLPCAAAWSIAKASGIRKMDVSSACEALKIKVKPCQLGAF